MSDRYRFIAAHASQYPVAVLCRVLGVARSGYYARRRAIPCARVQRDTAMLSQIETVFMRSRQTYGSPRVHATLQATGVRIARKRVARLMRIAGLVARTRRRSVATTVSDDSAHVPATNMLKRQFVATAPNQIWVADITYIPTREGWVYLAVVLDLFARRVVGWAIQATLDQTLTGAALAMAIHQRQPPAGLMHHSDRGSQYTSAAYQGMLMRIGATVSMSRRGNCWDNAVMESFFATLKSEIGTRVFPNHVAARSALFAYMEGFYNRQRRHSYLGYATPLQAELAWSQQHRG